MTVRVTHASTTGAAANPRVLVDGPKWDADHTVTGAAALDGGNTFTGTQTINPTTGTTSQGLVINQTLPSSGTPLGPILLNSITITNPGMSTSGSGWDSNGQTRNQVIGYKISYLSTGATTTNTAGLSVTNFITAATDAYGSLGGVTINANASGHYFWGHIGAAGVWADGSAGLLIGLDGEVGIATGGSAAWRFGVGADSQGPVQGSTLDSAFVATASGTTVPGEGTVTGWQHLMSISKNVYFSGVSPIASTGDFFFSDAAMTVAHFANLRNVTVTGNILDFPNMAIAGNGAAVFGNSGAGLPSSGILVYGPGGSPSNVQIFGGVPGATGAGGMVVNDSANTNILVATLGEAGNTSTRFGLTLANYAEVVSLGSTNLGLLTGTVTAKPLVFGTNNTFAGQITGGQQWALGSSAAPAAGPLLTLNGNTATPLAAFFGTKLLQIAAPDGVIGGMVADTYGAQSVYTGRVTGGTLASPTATAAATTIVSFGGQGWDGVSAYSTVATMDITTLNLQSVSDHSGRIRFRTIPSGSTTLAEAGSFQADGSLTVGASATAAGAGNLNLGGGSLLNNGTSPTGTGAYVRASSPTFTGTPFAPTAAVDTATTQIATTAMVLGQAASAAPLGNGTAAVGSSTRYARADHVHPIDTHLGQMAVSIAAVNFNSANTDNAIAIVLPPGYTRFHLLRVSITHASGSLTTSTFGLFTTTGGGGLALIPAGTANTVSTSADNASGNMQNASLGFPVSSVAASLPTPNTIYFRVGTAQGSAATGDVTAYYFPAP